MLQMDRRRFLAGSAACTLFPGISARADEPVRKKDPYADGVLKTGEPPMPAKDAFTIAVLPDTQHYSEKYPETFHAQTRWVAENQHARNIASVLQLGDVTNHNAPDEWKNASAAMKVLDDAKVPYAFCPGNHDYSEKGACKDRTTRLSEYFPVGRCRKQPSFGGVYDKEPGRTENSYHRFSAGGRDFLVLALEFGPRADVIRWANEIVTANAKREVILITHAFIYFDDTRYDWKKYGKKQKWNPHGYGIAKATNDDVSDGEELWNKLVSKHENFILTLNGHVLEDGLGKVLTKTPAGREIPQVLVNFQMRPNGGDGWLRLLEFRPDRSIHVIDYSPTMKKRNESKQNHFTLTAPAVKA